MTQNGLSHSILRVPVASVPRAIQAYAALLLFLATADDSVGSAMLRVLSSFSAFRLSDANKHYAGTAPFDYLMK